MLLSYLLKAVLINVIAILLMSVKLSTPNLPNIKVFQNKACSVIISVTCTKFYYVAQIIL